MYLRLALLPTAFAAPSARAEAIQHRRKAVRRALNGANCVCRIQYSTPAFRKIQRGPGPYQGLADLLRRTRCLTDAKFSEALGPIRASLIYYAVTRCLTDAKIQRGPGPYQGLADLLGKRASHGWNPVCRAGFEFEFPCCSEVWCMVLRRFYMRFLMCAFVILFDGSRHAIHMIVIVVVQTYRRKAIL